MVNQNAEDKMADKMAAGTSRKLISVNGDKIMKGRDLYVDFHHDISRKTANVNLIFAKIKASDSGLFYCYNEASAEQQGILNLTVFVPVREVHLATLNVKSLESIQKRINKSKNEVTDNDDDNDDDGDSQASDNQDGGGDDDDNDDDSYNEGDDDDDNDDKKMMKPKPQKPGKPRAKTTVTTQFFSSINRLSPGSEANLADMNNSDVLVCYATGRSDNFKLNIALNGAPIDSKIHQIELLEYFKPDVDSDDDVIKKVAKNGDANDDGKDSSDAADDDDDDDEDVWKALVVKKVDHTFDGGRVSCVATVASFQTINATNELNVQYIPKIDCPQLEPEVTLGKPKQVTCKVKANPPAEIILAGMESKKNDGVTLTRTPIGKNEVEIMISIPEVKQKHLVTSFNIVASNFLGSNNSTSLKFTTSSSSSSSSSFSSSLQVDSQHPANNSGTSLVFSLNINLLLASVASYVILITKNH
ncbi:hypothetical protein HELRODRAFT_194761 [Helobdella robusta]|uniref:Uncharacterized protein n=1 Tax=Helobdella robusta TaxID=6412 RepID=T1FWD9_HELRO|nr:hypothetical protein HELRODRAFT_194761 [Helobdella robusta]ESN89915.1 hypothetical protein HELRODRAFT_194761 [Helobdella robusta]